MKINKSNSISGAFTTFLFGIFIYIFLFGLTLLQETSKIDMGFLGKANVHLPIFQKAWQNGLLFFLLSLLPVICVERAAYDMRRGLGIRKDEMGGNKSVWRSLAVIYKYADFVNNILFALIFLAFTAFDLYVLVHVKLTFTVNSLIFLLGIVVYMIPRKALSTGLKKASGQLRRGFPSFTFSENGIEMRLYPEGKSRYAVNPPLVRLEFDELDEVKVLDDVEAENFTKYMIGPDLELSKAMVSDKYKYLKGEIHRPTVFRSGTCTNSKSVFFRGKALFYLITFETDDVEIIEESFQKYKEMKQENH